MDPKNLDPGDDKLFGIIAESFHFVAGDSLEDARRKQRNDASATLGETLLSEQAITADEYQEIRLLVNKYVENCKEDPHGSLERSKDPSSVLIEVLGQVNDPQIKRSLFRLAQQTIANEPTQASELQDLVDDSAHNGLESTQESVETAVSFIGPFPIEEMLGEGSFGVVWKATDPRLDRPVAIKVAKPNQGIRVDRFSREAKAAAQLRHPHIVPVYECGDHGNAKFIVYEFVEGTTLKSLLRSRGKYSYEGAAILVSKLAEALHYAHERGIIHRDIKPDNVLIDEHDEPHITDFGLAKQIDDESAAKPKRSTSEFQNPDNPEGPSLLKRVFGAGQEDTEKTAMGSVLGTPAYMSPEQAEGQPVDGRSDLWSLGVIFGELLTSRRPFYGSTVELLHQIRTRDPTPLRELHSSVPKDLQAIWGRCLRKDSAERFQTGQELADELNRWRRGEPVRSRPISVFARTGRWARRNPAIASLLATVFLTLMAGVTLAFLARGREMALRNEEVNSILSVLPREYPALLDDLQARSRGKALASALKAELHIRAEVARLCFDDQPDPDTMVQTLTRAPDAEEYLSFLAAMQKRHEGVLAGLGEFVSNADEDASKRFRAACGIAMFGEQSIRADWDDSVFAVIAGSLIRESRDEGRVWTNSVRSVRDALRPELEKAFGEGRVPAAEVLAELFEDDVESLIGWLATATPFQLSSLVAKMVPGRRPSHSDRPLQQRKTAALEMLARNRSQSNPVKQPIETANLAVAQWALGEVAAVGELLKAGSDNTVRTLIIHRIPHGDSSPQRVIERLASQAELATSVRTALWLTLGEYDKYSLTGVSERSRIEELAANAYATAPSGGVHSAIEWLLRRWNLPVPDTQRELTHDKDPPWLTLAGHTMVAFRKPQVRREVPSVGGVTVYDSKTEELPHSFAIATKEVTVGQFLEFLDTAEIPADSLRRTPLDQLTAADPVWPMHRVPWRLALQYCEWLSKSRLGLEPAQRLEEYPSADVADYRGIRLPTEIEWDCACLAGSEDERFYGKNVGREMERVFARYGSSPGPVGLLKPNDWGLFDMRGNVSELTLDRLKSLDAIRTMGGSYSHVNYKSDIGPGAVREYVGFRIAVTID
jgi:serine/threonine protein kinase